MNHVILIGNLTRDPELSQTPSGVSVCRFSIAVTRSYAANGEEPQTDFFNCTAWRALAENVAKFQRKGCKIAVYGSIQLRNYEDNKGIKRTAVDIICQNVEFLSSPSQSRNGGRPVLEEFEDDGDSPF